MMIQQQQPPAALHLPDRQHPLIYNHRCSNGIEKKPLGYTTNNRNSKNKNPFPSSKQIREKISVQKLCSSEEAGNS
jgi:hypothetical protein